MTLGNMHVRQDHPQIPGSAPFVSEEHYRRLIETARDVCYTVTPDGTLASVNPAFRQMTGWSPEDWLGKSYLELLHPDDVPLARERFSRLMVGESLPPVEYRFRTAFGSYVIGEVSATTIWENGRVSGVLGIARDVTERAEAEAALRESEERYRLLVDQATDIIYRTDAAGRFTFVNPTTMRLMGYTESEVLGHRFIEFIGPDYRARTERFYGRQFVRKEPTTYFEFPALTRDDRIIWLGQNVQLLQANGRITGFSAVARDITERKRAEQALAASEKRLKTILETEPQCVTVVTQDCVLLDMNPAGLKAMEADTLEEMLGRSVLPIIAPTHRDAFADFIRHVHAGQPGFMQFEIIGLKGGHRWMETHAVPLRNDRNNTIEVLGVTRDITERKQTEEALHRALRAREQLARNLHDNIIQSIYAIGFTLEECQELLSGMPANANRKLNQVIAELNRVIREVRGYLATSEEESESLTAGELIASLQRLGGLMERANGVRFSLTLDRIAAAALTAGQRAQFLYVAQEAMSNSLRHSNASTVRVSLACAPHGVRLEICDNGVGFALRGMRNGSGGLKNIRLRARKIGANLDISSHPMGGTLLSMEVLAGK